MKNNWNMLGHEWAVELLQGHLTNERARHAYLITGPQGVGRRTLAIRLSQTLNCTEPFAPGVPCGGCRSCTLIERMQHPDLSVVEAEQIGGILKVDQIRELQRSLSLAPYESDHKIALLLRFEEANPNAANALLKTLEEPPPKVVMLITASDVDALLPTIVSRCEVIRLRPLRIEQVADGLQKKWGLPSDEAVLLAHLSGGRPGYAYSLSQHPEMLEQRQKQLDDLQQLLSSSRVARFAYAEDLVKDKLVLQSTLKTWLSLWRDVMLSTAGSSTPVTNIDRQDQIHQISHGIQLKTAHKMVIGLEKTQSRLARYTNPRLTLEVLMLDLPQIQF